MPITSERIKLLHGEPRPVFERKQLPVSGPRFCADESHPDITARGPARTAKKKADAHLIADAAEIDWSKLPEESDDGVPSPPLTFHLQWLLDSMRAFDAALASDSRIVDAVGHASEVASQAASNADNVFWAMLDTETLARGARELLGGNDAFVSVVSEIELWAQRAQQCWATACRPAMEAFERDDFNECIRITHTGCLELRKVLRSQVIKLMAEFEKFVVQSKPPTIPGRGGLTVAQAMENAMHANTNEAIRFRREWVDWFQCAPSTVAAAWPYKSVARSLKASVPGDPGHFSHEPESTHRYADGRSYSQKSAHQSECDNDGWYAEEYVRK